MAENPFLAPDMLRQLVDYDPLTGEMTWLPRPAWMFEGKSKYGPERDAAIWNTRWAGKPALSSLKGHGAKGGTIFGRNLKQHRVAWAVHYGKWPKFAIDHINGNASDNRIANLRDVPSAENMKNTSLPRHNSSGVIGVSWDARWGKWRATIKVARKAIELGRFVNFDDAVKARSEAQAKYGFHANHGRCP